MSEQSRSPEQKFLDRLDEVAPDISGMTQVSLDDPPARLSMTEYRRLAASRGWEVDRTERSGRNLSLRIKRIGTVTTHRHLDSEFLSGPSLAELRGNTVVREEAARVLRETGVDVLSEQVLDHVRRRHVTGRRRVTRLAWLSALPGVFALAGVMFSFVLWRDGGTQAGNVLMMISLVAAVVCAATMPFPVKAEKVRRAAVADYKAAYERVVSTALKDQARTHD